MEYKTIRYEDTLDVKATPRFERMLKRLHKEQQVPVLREASNLSSNPYIGKRLAGQFKGLYSLRIGNLRALYYIDAPKNCVWLVAVGERRSIYK